MFAQDLCDHYHAEAPEGRAAIDRVLHSVAAAASDAPDDHAQSRPSEQQVLDGEGAVALFRDRALCGGCPRLERRGFQLWPCPTATED